MVEEDNQRKIADAKALNEALARIAAAEAENLALNHRLEATNAQLHKAIADRNALDSGVVRWHVDAATREGFCGGGTQAPPPTPPTMAPPVDPLSFQVRLSQIFDSLQKTPATSPPITKPATTSLTPR